MEVAEVRKIIVEAIHAKYNMNLHEFSESEWPTKIGVAKGNTLRCYLSGASTSFPTYRTLVEHFRLGKLTRERVVQSHTEYKIAPIVVPTPRQLGKRPPVSPA